MNIGILGGGQLGWMTILEGRKLGFKFSVLDKDPHAPANSIADRWYPPEKVEEFYKASDVITYEFEHIEEDILQKVEDKLLPNPTALRLKRERKEEKTFLHRSGYPLPRFTHCTLKDLKNAISTIGLPAVVKADRLGYDGKGQYRVTSPEDIKTIEENHEPNDSFVVEEMVDFVAEVSAVGVRSHKGEILIFPPTQNVHREGILLYNHTLEDTAHTEEITRILSDLMEDLSIVGLLAVEFFITREGKVLINEFAPRPHNTGHYTLDATYTSQFENLLRSITHLPLGSTQLKTHAGMVNILGMGYDEIPIEEILSVEGAKLYWYGKEKRQRRKMGHINVVGRPPSAVRRKIENILKLLYQEEFSLK